MLKLNPAGTDVGLPLLSLKLYVNGGTPPAPCTGIKEATGVFLVKLFVGIGTVDVSAGQDTANWNVLVAVCGVVKESVTVTVYEATVLGVIRDPLIAPVVVLNENPVGNAGLTE